MLKETFEYIALVSAEISRLVVVADTISKYFHKTCHLEPLKIIFITKCLKLLKIYSK